MEKQIQDGKVQTVEQIRKRLAARKKRVDAIKQDQRDTANDNSVGGEIMNSMREDRGKGDREGNFIRSTFIGGWPDYEKHKREAAAKRAKGC